MTTAQVAEAAVRERETQEESQAPAREPEWAGADPEELAELWAARHHEWRRVQALMETSGWKTYEPEQDAEGSARARERETQRTAFIASQTAHQERLREAKDELRAEAWLSAPAGRRIRALAARARLTPDQIVAQLAEHAVVGEDSTVSVPAFTPR
ncbi:hypothetical protein [Streptomyces jumonjinensis]|nr:hypothetical protein [Streptomyces jumonjinensis]